MKPRQPPKVARPEEGANSSRRTSLGDVSGSPIPDLCSQQAEVFFVRQRNRKEFHRMAPTTLSCKECGQEYPLEAHYVCERASARSRSSTTTPGRPGRGEAEDPGGPGGHLALRRLPAARRAPARPGAARADAAGARRPAGRAPRASARSGSRTTRPTRPIRSRTASSPSRWRRRASSGSRPSPAPRPATSPTRSPRTPRRPGSTPTCSFPPTSRSRSCSRPASTGRSLVGRPRQLRRRQPALHAALGRAAVGVRERQPAPVLRRGVEDDRLRDWSSSSAGSCPTGSSARSPPGSLFTKIARGFEEWRELGLVEGELPAFNGAQADGCDPVADAFAAGHDVCRPQRPDDDRQEPRDRRPGRRRLRAGARPPHRRLGRARSPTTRSAPGSGCSRRRPASSPRRPAA